MPNRIDSPVQDSKVGPNKEGNGILGLIIAEEGEFKTKRGRFNMSSLERIVELGNSKEGGVRKRAQHPNASDDGLGSFSGRETNYRIDQRPNGSNIVRADMLFSDEAMTMNPRGQTPWGKYLMAQLSSDPGSIQNSIVLKYDEVQDELSDSGELAPIWMPTELVASDFVDSGDATHGDSLSSDELVSWLGEGSDRRIHTKLPAVVTDILDRGFPGEDREKIKLSFVGFVDRYLDARFNGEDVPNPKEPEVDPKTQEALAETNKTVAALSDTVKGLAELIKTDREDRKAESLAAKRSSDIAALCQMAGSTEAATFIANEALSAEDVKNKLFADMCNKSQALSDGQPEDESPSELAKLGQEFDKNQELLSAAGWSKDDWVKAQASERGVSVEKTEES